MTHLTCRRASEKKLDMVWAGAARVAAGMCGNAGADLTIDADYLPDGQPGLARAPCDQRVFHETSRLAVDLFRKRIVLLQPLRRVLTFEGAYARKVFGLWIQIQRKCGRLLSSRNVLAVRCFKCERPRVGP